MPATRDWGEDLGEHVYPGALCSKWNVTLRMEVFCVSVGSRDCTPSVPESCPQPPEQGQHGTQDSAGRWQETPLESWGRDLRPVPRPCWERRCGHQVSLLPLDVALNVLPPRGTREEA